MTNAGRTAEAGCEHLREELLNTGVGPGGTAHFRRQRTGPGGELSDVVCESSQLALRVCLSSHLLYPRPVPADAFEVLIAGDDQSGCSLQHRELRAVRHEDRLNVYARRVGYGLQRCRGVPTSGEQFRGRVRDLSLGGGFAGPTRSGIDEQRHNEPLYSPEL